MLKTRLFGLVLVIIFAGMIYYGWYQLREEGVYYTAFRRSASSAGSF